MVSVVAFVVMADCLHCEAKCQTFLGENNREKKLIETKKYISFKQSFNETNLYFI